MDIKIYKCGNKADLHYWIKAAGLVWATLLLYFQNEKV